MFGETTDPFPYLLAAYAVGFLVIGGFAVSIIRDRVRLRTYLQALLADTPQGSRVK